MSVFLKFYLPFLVGDFTVKGNGAKRQKGCVPCKERYYACVTDEVFYCNKSCIVNFSKTLISVRDFASGVMEITPLRTEIISLVGSQPES